MKLDIKKYKSLSTDDSDLHRLFFLNFVIPLVKYNIYGLGRFADNHIN